MKKNLFLLLTLTLVLIYIQFAFKDSESRHDLFPTEITSLEIKQVKISFNKTIAYFEDDLMPVDSNKMFQILTYFKNIKIVTSESTEKYSHEDLAVMFSQVQELKINDNRFTIGVLQEASGRFPVKISNRPELVFWCTDDNSVLMQYQNEQDAHIKRYQQLISILNNNKNSLFASSVFAHWDMLTWKKIKILGSEYASEVDVEQKKQTNPNLQVNEEALDNWFYNLTEVVAIGYHKQSDFADNYKFRIEFQSGQITKWVEGYTNLNGKSGYYIRISDQAFVYHINLASWHLLTLNWYSFISRYPLKHHKKDKLIFENEKIDQNSIRSLHTLFLGEPAQSLSLDRPSFTKSLLLTVSNDQAEILIVGDKIIMHWLNSQLYYFYQNKQLTELLGKYK